MAVVTFATIGAFAALGFLGGILGAAIGGLPALGLSGGLVTLGELLEVAGIDLELPSFLAPLELTGTPLSVSADLTAVGLGPLFGPHVAFVGGVAASAYVGRRDMIDPTFRYHPAKLIRQSPGRETDVLAVGGIFGSAGLAIAAGAAAASLPLDPIALAVVGSALLHRVAFGYPAVGRLRALDRSVFDMRLHASEVRWGDDGFETNQGITGRPVVEIWQPAFFRWPQVAILGLVVGLAAAALSIVTESLFLAFGIATLALAARQVEQSIRQSVPVSIPAVHHVALPAAIVALALESGGETLGSSQGAEIAILAGAAVGVGAALLGELAQRVVYAHADTHLDPGFLTILLLSLLLTGIATVGILDPAAVPYPTI